MPITVFAVGIVAVAVVGGGAIASFSGVAALVVFMIQNTEDVTVEFLTWQFTWPVWLLVLVAALIGAFVWFGLGVLRRHQRRKSAARTGGAELRTCSRRPPHR